MKKILIVSHAMELGGAENALLGLLEHLDTTKYKIDLFLLRHQGELMPFIPKGINLLPESPAYSSMAVPIGSVLKRRQFPIAFSRAIGKYKAKKRIKQLEYDDSDIELEYSHKYTVSHMPMISSENYDLAISFLTPHYYVAQKVNAKKKIAWIHTDYSVVQVDRESQEKMWNQYDKIVSISDKVTESFVKIFPILKRKIISIGNMMPMDYISRLSQAFEVSEEMPDGKEIKLLSIGRFCTAKNFDNIPEICRYILNEGIKVKWYLIGFGSDEALIRDKIKEFHMEDYVEILGKKVNPYPYIKACDLYVQPSRYEGKCVSVLEAQSLHKPVIITNYATAKSQLMDGTDGVIVSMDNMTCAKDMARIINDKKLQTSLISNTYNKDYSNSDEVFKIYELV